MTTETNTLENIKSSVLTCLQDLETKVRASQADHVLYEEISKHVKKLQRAFNGPDCNVEAINADFTALQDLAIKLQEQTQLNSSAAAMLHKEILFTLAAALCLVWLAMSLMAIALVYSNTIAIYIDLGFAAVFTLISSVEAGEIKFQAPPFLYLLMAIGIYPMVKCHNMFYGDAAQKALSDTIKETLQIASASLENGKESDDHQTRDGKSPSPTPTSSVSKVSMYQTPTNSSLTAEDDVAAELAAYEEKDKSLVP